MLLSSLSIYTVHTDPEAEEPLASTLFVREGFNPYAFIFTVLWVLYHRMWWVFVGLMAVDLMFYLLAHFDFVNHSVIAVCRIFVQLWFGFHANDLLRWSLGRRGYLTRDVVSGESRTRAEQRFFDRIAHNNPMQPWGAA